MNKLTPQQAHKLHILFLMLIATSSMDAVFDQPSDPTNQNSPTNRQLIKNLVNDVPGADAALDQWLANNTAAYNTDRANGHVADTDFVSSAGNGTAWGGPNGCPSDLPTMISWLAQV